MIAKRKKHKWFVQMMNEWLHLPALHRAVVNDHPQVVIALMEKNVNLEQRDHIGRTALHFAADYNRLKIGKMLKSSGANVSAKDLLGNCPREYANSKGIPNSEFVKMLSTE